MKRERLEKLARVRDVDTQNLAVIDEVIGFYKKKEDLK